MIGERIRMSYDYRAQEERIIAGSIGRAGFLDSRLSNNLEDRFYWDFSRRLEDGLDDTHGVPPEGKGSRDW